LGKERSGQTALDGADTLEWTHLPSPLPITAFTSSRCWDDACTRAAAKQPQDRAGARSIALVFFVAIMLKYVMLK